MEETKVIKSNKTARTLIKKKFNLIDIKPHKHDNRRSVFVFELTEELMEFITSNNLEV